MTPVSVTALLDVPFGNIESVTARHLASVRRVATSNSVMPQYATSFIKENLYPNLYFQQFGAKRTVGKRSAMEAQSPGCKFLEGLPFEEIVDAAHWLSHLPVEGETRMLQDGRLVPTVVGKADDFYELAWEARLNVSLKEPWRSVSGDAPTAERKRYKARTTPGREPTRKLRSK